MFKAGKGSKVTLRKQSENVWRGHLKFFFRHSRVSDTFKKKKEGGKDIGMEKRILDFFLKMYIFTLNILVM